MVAKPETKSGLKKKCLPHHFIIDCHNIGHCKNDGCEETRDYNKLQARESGLSGLKPVRGGKRGRRKKEK